MAPSPAWTATKTWNSGDVPTATEFNNYVRDNLDNLKNGRDYGLYVLTSTKSVTSTSFTNVDATNWSFDIATEVDNTLILLGVTGVAQAGGTAEVMFVTWTVAGTNIGNATNGLQAVSCTINNYGPIGICVPYLVTTASTVTCNVQFRSSGGNSISFLAGSTAWAKEIG